MSLSARKRVSHGELGPEVIRGWIPCGPGIGFGGFPSRSAVSISHLNLCGIRDLFHNRCDVKYTKNMRLRGHPLENRKRGSSRVSHRRLRGWDRGFRAKKRVFFSEAEKPFGTAVIIRKTSPHRRMYRIPSFCDSLVLTLKYIVVVISYWFLKRTLRTRAHARETRNLGAGSTHGCRSELGFPVFSWLLALRPKVLLGGRVWRGTSTPCHRTSSSSITVSQPLVNIPEPRPHSQAPLCVSAYTLSEPCVQISDMMVAVAGIELEAR